MENRRVVLASRPTGPVTEGNFQLEKLPIPKPADGEVLVKNLWLSLDPYMRGRMSDAKSYVKGVDIGEVMVGQTVGEVLESKNDKIKRGDKVLTQLGWQLYGCTKDVNRIDGSRAPLTYYLGVLGMPGMTAYFGLKEIGSPKPGETVVVSAASGAVGSVVGQLAKIHGCRAVGFAGGPAKCEYVIRELGFDACIDYKSADAKAAFAAATPGGVDIVFENVGGSVLSMSLSRMNSGGRISVCGLIAGYDGQDIAIRNVRSILVNRLTVTGFIVSDHTAVWPQALGELARHVADGRIKYRESIATGIE